MSPEELNKLKEESTRLATTMGFLASKNTREQEQPQSIGKIESKLSLFSRIIEELESIQTGWTQVLETGRAELAEGQAALAVQRRELGTSLEKLRVERFTSEDEAQRERQASLERREELIEIRENRIAEREGQLADAREQISAREAKASALEALLETRQRHLVDEELKLSDQRQALEEANLSGLQTQISELHVSFRSREDQLREMMESQLAAAQDSSRQYQEIKESLGTIGEDLAASEDKDQQIFSASTRVCALEVELSDLQRELEECRKSRDDLLVRLAETESQADVVARELSDVTQIRDSLTFRVADIEEALEADREKLEFEVSLARDECKEVRTVLGATLQRLEDSLAKTRNLEHDKADLTDQLRAPDNVEGPRRKRRRDDDAKGVDSGAAGRWLTKVDALAAFLYACHPLLHTEAEEVFAVSKLAVAVLSEAAEANLVLFKIEADPGKWFCFDEVAANGHDRGEAIIPATGTCVIHGTERCLQIQRGSAGIVCRVHG